MSHTLPKTDAESEKWRFPFRFRPIFSGKLVVLGMVMHPKHQDTWRHISPFWKFDQYVSWETGPQRWAPDRDISGEKKGTYPIPSMGLVYLPT